MLFVRRSIQTVTFFPTKGIIKASSAAKTCVLSISHAFSLQTATLHPELPGRRSTISTLPSSLSSVRRGRVALGLLYGISPSDTSTSPISSAVMPLGLPFRSTSMIAAFRLGTLGLVFAQSFRDIPMITTSFYFAEIKPRLFS